TLTDESVCMNRKLILSTLLTIIALAVWWSVPGDPKQSIIVGPKVVAGPSAEEQRHAAIQRIEPNLDWADEECRKAIAERLKPLEAFFVQAKKRTPTFAEHVLGWGSKWRFVADRMPFTRGGRHDEY